MRIVVLIVANDRPELIKTTISACELAIDVTQLPSAQTFTVIQIAVHGFAGQGYCNVLSILTRVS